MLSPAAPEGCAGPGDDPPGTPRGPVSLPRLRRAGCGRAGPGGRPPRNPPRAGQPPATSSRRLRPCWPGGTTPPEPPEGRSASPDLRPPPAASSPRVAPCSPGGTTPPEPPEGRSASRDFLAQAAAVLARGDDPPGTPRGPVSLPRLPRAGCGRAGPGGRPPRNPPRAGQ